MAMITIPTTQHRAVQRLFGLSPERMSRFIESIQVALPTSSFRALARQLQRKMSAPINSLNPILQMISALGALVEDEDLTAEEIATELIAASQEDGIDAEPPDKDWNRLKRDLARLFDVAAPIIVTGRAASLISEHEHVFCADNSRIISDVRPIFPAGDILKPVGAVIVHMLKLAYHQDKDTKEFFVALDTEDVRLLRDLLDRAIAKEVRINEALESSAISLVGDEAGVDQ